jgi:hypothetical protein
LAKFIFVEKEIDGYEVALNTDEIISIAEFDKLAGNGEEKKSIRVQMKGGYWVDVSNSFYSIKRQLEEMK